VGTSYGLTGRQAESALLDAGVVTNRNAIPRDPNGAWYTSGVRLGTPALTTLGLGAGELDEVAELIDTTLRSTSPSTTSAGAPSKAKYAAEDGVAEKVRERAGELLSRFPLYPGLAL
jgi:glycine hydroxymethyltransferase